VLGTWTGTASISVDPPSPGQARPSRGRAPSRRHAPARTNDPWELNAKTGASFSMAWPPAVVITIRSAIVPSLVDRESSVTPHYAQTGSEPGRAADAVGIPSVWRAVLGQWALRPVPAGS